MLARIAIGGTIIYSVAGVAVVRKITEHVSDVKELPKDSFIEKYADRKNCYKDAYSVKFAKPVKLDQYLHSFMCSPFFSMERSIFALLSMGETKTDDEIKATIFKKGDGVALWKVIEVDEADPGGEENSTAEEGQRREQILFEFSEKLSGATYFRVIPDTANNSNGSSSSDGGGGGCTLVFGSTLQGDKVGGSVGTFIHQWYSRLLLATTASALGQEVARNMQLQERKQKLERQTKKEESMREAAGGR